MPDFKVETTFKFKGHFKVTAENMKEARRIVENDCGLVMGGSIHTTLDEKDIDWNFDTHPEKDIVTVTKA